ncbi:MAG: hypothetical protein HY854_21915 [Burkholderiales bacterium]|nr:hypothetical protein [Burkholderiales bacterium]
MLEIQFDTAAFFGDEDLVVEHYIAVSQDPLRAIAAASDDDAFQQHNATNDLARHGSHLSICDYPSLFVTNNADFCKLTYNFTAQ